MEELQITNDFREQKSNSPKSAYEYDHQEGSVFSDPDKIVILKA